MGADLAQEVARRALAIYDRAREFAATKGIIIADTKFEFGTMGGELILIDEVLTPDSSRFWPARTSTRPAGGRRALTSSSCATIWRASALTRSRPAPKLPAEVIEGTRQRYLEALTRLTGHGLANWSRPSPVT